MGITWILRAVGFGLHFVRSHRLQTPRRLNTSHSLVILVSFYSLLPIKTTPESREECELVSGFDGAGFSDLGVDTNILIKVAHDVAQDGAIGR